MVGEREIVVCQHDGRFYALDNICSHAHAQLHQGRLRRGRLICPLHGAAFDVRTGQPLGTPAEAPLVTYPVRVVDDMLEIDLDG